MFNRFGMVLCDRVRGRWCIVKEEEEELEHHHRSTAIARECQEWVSKGLVSCSRARSEAFEPGDFCSSETPICLLKKHDPTIFRMNNTLI